MEGKGKTLLAFLCFAEGFASAEATKGLSDSPLETFGALLLERIGFFTKTRFLVEGKGKTFLAFLCFAEDFASAEATKGLSARPFETFGALLLGRIGFFTKTRFLVEGKGKSFLAFLCFAEGFASAEATRGLSARPLDPFGGPLCDEMLASREAERYLFATPTIFQ